MSSQDTPRLRGGGQPRGFWALGSIPDDVVYKIGQQLVHRLAIGHADITGDDFGTIFANAIGGKHRQSPLGIADVVKNGSAWSVKTIGKKTPFREIGKYVRLISGRNSPDYSFNLSDPRKDLKKTGRYILSIWNSRIDKAQTEHDDLRIAVLIRCIGKQEFVLFEEEAVRFAEKDYYWKTSKQKTIWGFRKTDDRHCFVWQPHGGQFTILREVPSSARLFEINKAIPIIEEKNILALIRFDNKWISIHD